MIIETERLRLRPAQESDVDGFVQSLNDWESVAQWLNNPPYPFTEFDAREYIRMTNVAETEQINYKLVIAGKTNDEFLGFLSLRAQDEKATLGYWLAPSAGGHGYMVEASSALIATARAKVPGLVVCATTDPENKKSEHVLLKMGFRQVSSSILDRPRRRGTIGVNRYELATVGMT